MSRLRHSLRDLPFFEHGRHLKARRTAVSRRRPAQRCVICNLTIEESGGKRLIATPRYGISLRTIHARLGSIRHPSRTIRLTGNYRDLIVVISESQLWSDEVVERIRQVTQLGFRAWACQRCVHHQICEQCSSPLVQVPVADYLEDDGRTVHAPFLPGFAQSCPNPDCPNHRPPRDTEI